MKNILILLLCGACSGCAVVRSADPFLPVHPPAGVSSAVAQPESPTESPEGAMTLQQAVRLALANNPEIAARRWDVAASEARRDRASGERLPRLGVAGDYYHHLDEQRILPVGAPGDPSILSRDILSADLVLSMPLFTAGRLINRVRAADLLRRAAEQQLARTREELVFNVTSVFNSIIAQHHVIESLEFSGRTLKEHARRIDALIAAQKAAPVDRMRTEVRLADIEQQLVREKSLRSIQRRALANLLGLTDLDPETSLQGDLEMEEGTPLPSLEAAFSTAWESRGDYLAARYSLEAQTKNVDVARSGRWPTLSLQGAYGGRWAAGPTTGTGDEQGDVGRVGLVLDVPLFEGGQVNADIREQRADLAAAQERLRRLELQVRLEVETALLNVKSSRERAASIRKSIEQARESLRIEQQKYSLGKGAVVDVLDAQAALLESETTYYRVLAEYHTAVAHLKLAMGTE